MRGYNIARTDLMMNFSIKPAQYSLKYDNYSQLKNGYVVVDFTPITQG